MPYIAHGFSVQSDSSARAVIIKIHRLWVPPVRLYNPDFYTSRYAPRKVDLKKAMSDPYRDLLATRKHR